MCIQYRPVGLLPLLVLSEGAQNLKNRLGRLVRNHVSEQTKEVFDG